MQPLAIAGVLSVMSGTQSNQPKQKTPKGEEIPVPERGDFAGLDLRMR
jgi:hypothetical protein